MSLRSLLSLATLLYKKLRSAQPDERATVMAFIREARDSGMVPLGMRPDHDRFAYVWLVFDESRLTLNERERYVLERTPPVVRGANTRIVTISL